MIDAVNAGWHDAGVFGRRRKREEEPTSAASRSNDLAFWPEYNGGPLWSADGRSVDPEALALPSDLVRRLVVWNSIYDDSKLPFENSDTAWLDEGTNLLSEIRATLGDAFHVVVTEPWWGRAAERITADPATVRKESVLAAEATTPKASATAAAPRCAVQAVASRLR